MLAPAANGGTCYSILFGKRGYGNISCPTRRWRGPALQLGFNDLLRGTFFSGSVRANIARIELHLPDGRVIRARPIKDQVLTAIPPRYARTGHAGSYIVAYDRHGTEILRGRVEN
jgi:hypothetical protein